jgi:hypothetical protein
MLGELRPVQKDHASALSGDAQGPRGAPGRSGALQPHAARARADMAHNQSWKRREARDRYENSPKGIARRLDYAARHLPSTTELLEWSRRMPLQLPKRNERQAWAAYRVWRSGGVKNPERP